MDEKYLLMGCVIRQLLWTQVWLLGTMISNSYESMVQKRKADILFTSNFIYSALKFSEIIQFYLVVFQKYSNSNYILYPSMEYLTTKILKLHPNLKHVASFHSKRQLAVLASLHWLMESRIGIGCPPSASVPWLEGTIYIYENNNFGWNDGNGLFELGNLSIVCRCSKRAND